MERDIARNGICTTKTGVVIATFRIQRATIDGDVAIDGALSAVLVCYSIGTCDGDLPAVDSKVAMYELVCIVTSTIRIIIVEGSGAIALAVDVERTIDVAAIPVFVLKLLAVAEDDVGCAAAADG